MTRRMWVLFGAVIVAAMPLTWLSLDPNAGDVLLRLTQPKAMHDAGARPARSSLQSNQQATKLSPAKPTA